MAELNVIWTKTADIQFAGILEYWVNRNKSTAIVIIAFWDNRQNPISLLEILQGKNNLL
ncbi:hypothetical protein [Maribacter sp. IgM3_T14_3]|uniref:hypothetical protein n=1 Tax=Maribacter sp. IgM3_T14_3 TaxID=3415140 RepID=UPI003C6F3B85